MPVYRIKVLTKPCGYPHGLLPGNTSRSPATVPLSQLYDFEAGNMKQGRMSLIFGGDISIGEDPFKYFSGVIPMLEAADVRMAQLETPYVKTVSEFAGVHMTTAALAPLTGHFDLMTVCGNHFYDLGETGVKDTLEWLDEHKIAHAGGGNDYKSAKEPAFFEKNRVRFGVLGYNALGPKSSFANETKGGCASVNFTRAMIPVGEDVSRHENDTYDYKKPIHIDSDVNICNFPDASSLMSMQSDISALRPHCDVLIVYFHKGMVHKPVEVADHERMMCRMAIDAGADVVFSSHSHLLRGCEVYKGKTIYHGLNNFVMWAPGLSPFYKGKKTKTTEFSSGGGEEWVKKRVERFGFIPDIEYPTYPFHPDSIYTIAAKCVIEDGMIAETRYIPLLVNKEGITNVVGRLDGGQAVFDYMVKITEGAGLNVRYEWDGDEVLIIEK